MLAKRLPEQARPLDVIITVEVAAADGRSRELKFPEYETDDDSGGE